MGLSTQMGLTWAWAWTWAMEMRAWPGAASRLQDLQRLAVDLAALARRLTSGAADGAESLHR